MNSLWRRDLKAVNIFAIGLIVVIAVIGCRKPPADPPRYYESELREIRIKRGIEKQADTPKTYLSDRYPWQQPAKQSSGCVSCAIANREEEYQREIDRIRDTVHRRPRARRRLRD